MFEERFVHCFDLKDKQEKINGLEKKSFYVTQNSSKKPLLNFICFEIPSIHNANKKKFGVSFYGEKFIKLEHYESQDVAEKRAYDCASRCLWKLSKGYNRRGLDWTKHREKLEMEQTRLVLEGIRKSGFRRLKVG